MIKEEFKKFFIFQPHNMIISGATNCGKTYFVLDLLETVYKDHFENIVIFCPTFMPNKTYDRKWIFKDKKVYIIDPNFVKQNLNLSISFCLEIFKGSKTLFLIDDCANLQDSKRKATEICNLAFSGRHYDITTWILIQKYNSIVKDFRENIQMLVLFYNKDETAMKQALEENAVIPKEQRNYIVKALKSSKKGKVIMRLHYPWNFYLFK